MALLGLLGCLIFITYFTQQTIGHVKEDMQVKRMVLQSLNDKLLHYVEERHRLLEISAVEIDNSGRNITLETIFLMYKGNAVD